MAPVTAAIVPAFENTRPGVSLVVATATAVGFVTGGGGGGGWCLGSSPMMSCWNCSDRGCVGLLGRSFPFHGSGTLNRLHSNRSAAHRNTSRFGSGRFTSLRATAGPDGTAAAGSWLRAARKENRHIKTAGHHATKMATTENRVSPWKGASSSPHRQAAAAGAAAAAPPTRLGALRQRISSRQARRKRDGLQLSRGRRGGGRVT